MLALVCIICAVPVRSIGEIPLAVTDISGLATDPEINARARLPHSAVDTWLPPFALTRLSRDNLRTKYAAVKNCNY